MKKYILSLVVALCLLSCDKREMITYSGGHYLSFTMDPKVDSIVTSFFFYPSSESLRVPIEVKLGGPMLSSDQSFKIVPVEGTTALAKNYQIESPTFRKGMVKDTVWVKLIKSDELSQRTYRLVLGLESDGFFDIGQKEYSTAKVVFSSLTAKPDWWTKPIADTYLGTYSDEKYRHFIIATEGRAAFFGERSSAEQRGLAIEFLNYLRKNKDEGNTVYDKDQDGNKIEMTITVRA